MPAKKWEFEGEMLTVKEIHERVPILGEGAIREHLQAGRNTRTAILSYVPRRAKPSRRSQFSIGKNARRKVE